MPMTCVNLLILFIAGAVGQLISLDDPEFTTTCTQGLRGDMDLIRLTGNANASGVDVNNWSKVDFSVQFEGQPSFQPKCTVDLRTCHSTTSDFCFCELISGSQYNIIVQEEATVPYSNAKVKLVWSKNDKSAIVESVHHSIPAIYEQNKEVFTLEVNGHHVDPSSKPCSLNMQEGLNILKYCCTQSPSPCTTTISQNGNDLTSGGPCSQVSIIGESETTYFKFSHSVCGTKSFRVNTCAAQTATPPSPGTIKPTKPTATTTTFDGSHTTQAHSDDSSGDSMIIIVVVIVVVVMVIAVAFTLILCWRRLKRPSVKNSTPFPEQRGNEYVPLSDGNTTKASVIKESTPQKSTRGVNGTASSNVNWILSEVNGGFDEAGNQTKFVAQSSGTSDMYKSTRDQEQSAHPQNTHVYDNYNTQQGGDKKTPSRGRDEGLGHSTTTTPPSTPVKGRSKDDSADYKTAIASQDVTPVGSMQAEIDAGKKDEASNTDGKTNANSTDENKNAENAMKTDGGAGSIQKNTHVNTYGDDTASDATVENPQSVVTMDENDNADGAQQPQSGSEPIII